jgi:serine/threonine-protein kinase
LDEALACHQEAIRLDPKDANAHTNLGYAQGRRGDLAGAIRSFRQAVRINPRLANAQGALGKILVTHGDFADACKAYQQALDLLPPASLARLATAIQLTHCQQLAELEQRFNGVLAGKHTPRDPADRSALAYIACVPAKQLYTTAARLYAEAFRAQPTLAADLFAGHRYNAGWAAALAGCGQGKDAAALDAAGRLRWRRQALTWLRAELAARARQLKSWFPGQASQARQALDHWRRDPGLSGVRDRDALAKLPPDERLAWQKLWADVDALRRTAQPKK